MKLATVLQLVLSSSLILRTYSLQKEEILDKISKSHATDAELQKFILDQILSISSLSYLSDENLVVEKLIQSGFGQVDFFLLLILLHPCTLCE